MIKQLTILFMLFSLFSCEKEHLGDCFNSTGSKKISYRDVALFSQIELDDRIDLDLIWDTSLSEVSVEAGNGIIDNIITEVKDGELKIYNTNKCNWVRSFKKQIKVTVRGSSWNKITYRGSGTIQSKNQISADLFFLDCWEASGDIYLNLKCNESYLKSHTGPTVVNAVSYTHLRAHETDSYLVCRFLFEKIFFLMIRRPPRSTRKESSAASDVYKRQVVIYT